jgi:hypothetical protein
MQPSQVLMLTCALLSVFALLEWPLFISLIAYRIYPDGAWTKTLIKGKVGLEHITMLSCTTTNLYKGLGRMF